MKNEGMVDIFEDPLFDGILSNASAEQRSYYGALIDINKKINHFSGLGVNYLIRPDDRPTINLISLKSKIVH
ncbi:hypothetical protein QFC21_007373, partial [Naganishia friedmannii]